MSINDRLDAEMYDELNQEIERLREQVEAANYDAEQRFRDGVEAGLARGPMVHELEAERDSLRAELAEARSQNDLALKTLGNLRAHADRECACQVLTHAVDGEIRSDLEAELADLWNLSRRIVIRYRKALQEIANVDAPSSVATHHDAVLWRSAQFVRFREIAHEALSGEYDPRFEEGS